MEKIPTAEDFYLESCYPRTFKENKQEAIDWLSTDEKGKKSIEIMIEFARLHVEAALENVLENMPYLGSTDTVSYSQIKEAVLNSYSLENIK